MLEKYVAFGINKLMKIIFKSMYLNNLPLKN